MKEHNILITTSTFAEYDQRPLEMLQKNGLKYRLNPFRRKVTSEEFVELVGDCIGVIAGTERLDSNVLQKSKSLKVISRCGVGDDNVDLEAAEDLGIKVFRTSSGPTLAVAELVISLALDLLRNITIMNQEMHQNKWEKKMGQLFSGKIIGIIGFGQIGQATAKLSQALGAEVVYYDPFIKEIKLSGARPLELVELLKKADIVTLHLSLSKENIHFIGPKELSLLKSGAYLINCSRGGIVDEDALYNILKEKRLAGAAVDVFEQEPYQGKLQELDNVILTPHIGSYAKEVRIKMELEAVDNLVSFLFSKGVQL